MGFLLSSSDSPPFLQTRPESLDDVAVVVDPFRASDSRFSAPGWDRRLCIHIEDVLAEAVAEVAAVAHHPERHTWKSVEQEHRIWTEFLRDGAPLCAVPVPPENSRERALKIMGRRLPLRPANFGQRLQLLPLYIREHYASE